MPTENKAPTSYRAILKRELELRLSRNARYSLRAFARDLGISPSRLSEVLSGRYGLSAESSRSIANRLGYSPRETEFFCSLVESRHARNKAQRQVARKKMLQLHREASFQTMNLDDFKSIASWYHFAILELAEVKGFQNDIPWIAVQLGISVASAKQAIERLLRLGLLKEKKGALRVVESRTATKNDVPSLAIKQFHQDILQKASEALFTQDLDTREFSTMVMAIPRRRIPAAKAAIRAFQRSFCSTHLRGDEKEDVYVLSTQFFSLLTREKLK